MGWVDHKVLPVDASHGGGLGESRVVLVGLLVNLVAVLHIVGRVNGVVNAGDDDQRPRDGDENAIRRQGLLTVCLAPGEGVVCQDHACQYMALSHGL